MPRIDVDAFFDEADFTTDAIYINPSGTKKDIKVIFLAAHSMSQIGDTMVENLAPQATCKSTDVSDATKATKLEIDSVVYKVYQPQPDGTGITRLILSKD